MPSGMTAPGVPARAGVDVERALALTAQAAAAVESGVAGYELLVAEKPAT